MFTKNRAKGFGEGKLLYIATLTDGLYKLDLEEEQAVNNMEANKSVNLIITKIDKTITNLEPRIDNNNPEIVEIDTKNDRETVTNASLLHYRLSHLNYAYIKTLVDGGFNIQMAKREALTYRE